ncbi:MAG: hypothetical protein JXN61_11570 [Sedimentisphaerales bacterium]|nr:hypothetical protein [Sedimentisphaerales bacterium]
MSSLRKMWGILFCIALFPGVAQVSQVAQIEEPNLPEDMTLRLVVTELRIRDNTLITTSELLEHMPEVYNASDQQLSEAPAESLYDLRVFRELVAEPGQPRQVSVRTIQGLTQYILSVYTKNGYAGIFVSVLEGAFTEDGNLIDGILPISVFEIPVDEVTSEFFDVERHKVEGYPLRLAIEEWSPVKRGKVLSQGTMDHFINLLNLIPDRYVSATIVRGAKPKTLALQYAVYGAGPSKLTWNKIMPQTKEPTNIARIVYDAYPHSDLLPIDAERDCRSLDSLRAKVTGENIGDNLFSSLVVEMVEGGESTLDGAIRVLERAKTNVDAVLRALRDADANQQ